MSHTTSQPVIENKPSPAPRWAVVDAQQRSKNAVANNESFFLSEAHMDRVEQVKKVVDSFFRVRKGLYVNHREGRGRPFTVVKVDNPSWPRMSAREVLACYREPLQALGVEIVFSRNTNSYLYRIY